MTSGSPQSPWHFPVVLSLAVAVMVLNGWPLTPLDCAAFFFLGFMAPRAVSAWISRRPAPERRLAEPGLVRPRPEILTMAHSLSTELAARLIAWHTEWSHLCSGTAPADRRRAEAAISELYRDLGEAPPRFVWVDSPIFATSDVTGINHRAGAGGPGRVSSRLETQLKLDLSSQAAEQMSGRLWEALRAQVTDALGGAPANQVWPRRQGDSWEPWAESSEDLIDRLTTEGMLDRYSRVDWGRYVDVTWAGLRGADWARLYTCCRDVVGVQYAKTSSRRLDLWREILRSCGWWWPYEDACVLCERPCAIHRDARGRLHHSSEPAFLFRDGFGLYRWHGTRVPQSWITAPEQLDPSIALTWPSLEQRRAAAEIIGWKRVLDRLPATTIDRHEDSTVGELLEVVLPGAGTARFLRVRCGTGREFVLSVPLGMRTARQANAWTYALEPDQYQLEART